MSQMPDPNRPPVFHPPPAPSRPQRYARRIGDWVRFTVVTIAWVVVLFGGVAIGVVALTGILWGTKLAIEALNGG